MIILLSDHITVGRLGDLKGELALQPIFELTLLSDFFAPDLSFFVAFDEKY
jgi:hypothetical protein